MHGENEPITPYRQVYLVDSTHYRFKILEQLVFWDVLIKDAVDCLIDQVFPQAQPQLVPVLQADLPPLATSPIILELFSQDWSWIWEASWRRNGPCVWSGGPKYQILKRIPASNSLKRKMMHRLLFYLMKFSISDQISSHDQWPQIFVNLNLGHSCYTKSGGQSLEGRAIFFFSNSVFIQLSQICCLCPQCVRLSYQIVCSSVSFSLCRSLFV